MIYKESELTTIIDKWLYFVKHASNLDVIPVNVTDANLIEAYEVVEQHKWSVEELNTYDRVSLKRGVDKSIVITAREEGLKEGHEKGHKEGQYEKALLIAKNMLEKGYSLEEVVKITGISESDLKSEALVAKNY